MLGIEDEATDAYAFLVYNCLWGLAKWITATKTGSIEVQTCEAGVLGTESSSCRAVGKGLCLDRY